MSDHASAVAERPAERNAELEWVRDVLASHGYVGPLAPACCPLADWLTERADAVASVAALAVEGKVVFERDPPEAADYASLCRVQCGPGGHIRKRSLVLNEATGTHPRDAHLRTLQHFIDERLLKMNALEGRRVRVTVEVLD